MEFLFDQIPFFAISKMAQNQFLNWGKSLKQPKMQFHEKNGFISIHEFFGLDFFKFSGPLYQDQTPYSKNGIKMQTQLCVQY